MPTRPLHELLAWNVRRLSHVRGIPLPTLAATIGITPARLDAIFTGDFDPDLDLLNKIANALGVGVGDILADTKLN
ncbi:helix-turn-helix domain-containing protein [Enhygromyxa salina]|uniref:helix-turn-helix domain-containing protein n=1 Tax=Enhygromyxa salina TaxID=215803 RepID=UPI0015E66AE0|nr:helix-turn-helix transcriptional regulator [Enhygromyxa salina]